MRAARWLFLTALLAASAVSAAEVFDYTADHPFTARHSKTFRLRGLSVAGGGGVTTDGKLVTRSSLESFEVYDIFPDRRFLDAFWVSWEGTFRSLPDVRGEVYFPVSGGLSFGPYWNLGGRDRRTDLRLLVGPSVQLLLLFSAPRWPVDDPPLLATLAGVRGGLDLFWGRNLAVGADLRWHAGSVGDLLALFIGGATAGSGPQSGIVSMRRPRFFGMLEWSLSARLFFGD